MHYCAKRTPSCMRSRAAAKTASSIGCFQRLRSRSPERRSVVMRATYAVACWRRRSAGKPVGTEHSPPSIREVVLAASREACVKARKHERNFVIRHDHNMLSLLDEVGADHAHE